MSGSSRHNQWRSRAIVLSAIAVMVAAVWFGGRVQRDASQRGADQVSAGEGLLTARLDMETGLRGFLLTGRGPFLEPYRNGLDHYGRSSRRAAALADKGNASKLVAEQDELTHAWIANADRSITRRRLGVPTTRLGLDIRKQLMDHFRKVNSAFDSQARRSAEAREDRARHVVIALIGVLGLMGLGLGYLLVERPAARSRRRRVQQTEFTEMLQFASTERDAQALVGRQIERVVPGSDAVVLAINNSENRLQPATELPADSELARKLRTAAPSSCLAVRHGKEYSRREGSHALIECELCGDSSGSSLCVPALVGGEIIGSVLVVRRQGSISGLEVERVEQTTSLAAPVLGNLRNLAIAETRAVTDSLTGLANSRAASETLRVMAAFASRSAQPLSAVLVDLDHFKQVNDTYGHQIGDEVLAAAGQTLKDSLRASDFVARYGGEEFLVLQGTPKREAGEVAEKMRRALAHPHVPGFASRISASFGVATIPDDAADEDSLLRTADEALYAAKESGRDRVVLYGEHKTSEGSADELAPQR